MAREWLRSLWRKLNFGHRRAARPKRSGRWNCRLEQLEDRSVPAAGTISVPGEQDDYSFTLANDSLLYFDSLTDTSNITWSLSGPPGAAVSNRAFNLSDSGSIGTNPVLNLPAGNYTLTVDGVNDTTGPYEFRLRDLAGAIPVTPGTPVSGDLSPANETDFYRFTAVTGNQYYFDVQARSGAGNAQWRLIDPFGGVVFSTS